MYAPEDEYRTPEKFAAMVDEAFMFASQNRSKREKYWRRNKLLYDNKTDLTHFRQTLTAMPYEDQLNIPTAFEKVEATMPMLCNALLGNNPMVRVKPREEGDRAGSIATQSVMDYQFEEDLDIRQTLPLLIRDALIYDTKIAYVGWKVEEHAAGKRFDPHTGKRTAPQVRKFDYEQGKTTTTDREAKPSGHPVLVGLERWHFYEDPLGTTVNGDEGACRFAIWKRRMTPTQLEDWVEATREITATEAKQKGIEPRPGKKWNMENCRRAYGMKDTANLSNDFGIKLRQEAGLRDNYTPGVHDDRMLEVLCWYEDEVNGVIIRDAAPVDGKGKGGPMCLLREPNPFWHGQKPFVAFRYVQLDNQFDGKALLDVIRDMCLEKSTRRQQRMDEVTRHINSWLFYNATQIKASDLKSRVMGPVPVRGNPKQAVESFRSQPIGTNAYEEARMIDEDIDRTSGLTPNLQGYGGGTDTARGIAMFIEQGTNRFKVEVGMLARMLHKVAVMVHELDRQFLPAEGVVRIAGKEKGAGWDFKPWTINDIARNYDFEFTCSPEEANQAMWRQNLTNGLAVMAGPDQVKGFLDWPEIAKAFFESLGYKGDAERFMLEDMSDAESENAMFLSGGAPVTATGDDNKHVQTHLRLVEPGGLAGLRGGVDPMQALQRVRAHLNDHAAKMKPQGGPAGPPPQGPQGPPQGARPPTQQAGAAR